MWPFKRTLSERYSNLVKLIKSIDSHFQLTEDKGDSVRLHLPNYKGNQPMDFHIYLLEPFLYISFITDVEGEIISCLNYFLQDSDQQDMFNAAMAKNLEKVRQALNMTHTAPKIGSNEKQEGLSPQSNTTITENGNTDGKSWDLRDYFDFDKSFKKHALTMMILRSGVEFQYFASRNDLNPMWSYTINSKGSLYENCPPDAKPFDWIIRQIENKKNFCWLLDILDEQIANLWIDSFKEPEELIKDIQKYVPSFKLINDPQSVKTNLEWSWIDIHAILYFIDYCIQSQNQLKSTTKAGKSLLNCATIIDIANLYYFEMNKEGFGEDLSKDIIKEKKDNVWIDEFGVMYSSDRLSLITAPKEIKDYSILQGTLIIKNNAFKDCTYLKRVSIPDSVTVVCNSVFEGCVNLQSVILPPKVTFWGVGIFYNCKSLQYINMPNGIKSINSGTFSMCKSLNKVIINDDNTEIGDYAFFECESLSSITIPKCITSIGIRSFAYCSNLASIDIPDGVKAIGEEAFYGCKKLKSISIPNSITNIGDSAFAFCLGLDSIIIPIGTERKFEELIPKHIDKFLVKDSIQHNSTIEESNIINCWTMKEFFMDNGRKLQRTPCTNRETGENFAMLVFGKKFVGFSKELGELTNSEINSLKNDLMVIQLKVDETVAQARREAGLQEETYRLYKKSAYLEEVYLTLKKQREESALNLTTEVTEEDFANAWVDKYGVKYSADRKRLLAAPDNLKDYSILEGTLVICDNSFCNLHNIVSLTIPSSVVIIGKFAFCYCKRLIDIMIPGNVRIIMSGAFCECSSLTKILLNYGLEIIEDHAFAGYKPLTSISIPNSIVEIGKEAFWNCCHIKKIIIPKSVKKIGSGAFSGCSSLATIIVEEGNGLYDSRDNCNAIIETKSNTLVCGCKNTIIPKNISVIGDLAFGDCNSIEQITIPEGIIEIEECAFIWCRNILTVELPSSLKRIKNRAFKGCANLRSVYIPENVCELGEEVFSGCTHLSTESNNRQIVVSPNNQTYDSRDNCNAIIKKVSNTLVCGCSKTIIPETITTIGDYAFSECKDLTSITIPDSVTSIGDHAFSGCSNLSTVYFPNSIMSIGNNVFYGCKLEAIHIPHGSKKKFENFLPQLKGILEEYAKNTNNNWTDEFGVEYNKEKVLLLKAPKDIEKYTVIEGTITIDNAAFSNCKNLKSVIIANSVTEIGHYAFANCNSLYLFAIPQNIRKLGSGAFMGCSELTSILLPNSIVFESGTFEGCEKLASMFVPQGEKYKYEGLFWNHDIDIKEYDPNDEEEMRMLNSIYHGILDECGVLYNYDEEILLSVTKPLEEYSVREGTIGIRVEAFKPDTMGIDRKSLKRLHLPDSLFMICDSAFIYNEGLEYINIPKNAKFLQDSNPFAGCFNLHTIKWETDNAVKEGTLIFNKERTALIACLPWQYTEGNTIIEQDSHVILPDGLETIAANTFYHDEKLQEITLPISVKEIGKDAFIGCSSLKTIFVPEGTLHKFEKMLPKWAGILKEQYKEVEDTLSDYELPDGSIYNGRCIRKSFGSIELSGLGSISYTNGDKYKGNFKYGRPFGWGIYFFKNGHKHKGYFDDIPNGIGYLNEDYDMAVGNFTNGRLNGWAICYRNRLFKFGYWREGRLITDYTTKTLWIRYEISNQRIEYKGNLIQMDEEHIFIRFGIPEKPLVNTYGNGIKNIWSLKEFFKAHGRMKIANMVNKNTQEHYKCLAFENPTTGVLCFVSFSSGLGELSGAEINNMKNELVVCELKVETEVAARRAKEGRQIESYSLCKMSAIPASQIPLSRVPKMPAYGFEFFKDGTVKVGIVKNHDSGEYMLCNKDGTVECGKWKENIKTSNNSSFDLDNPNDFYEEDGIDVYKKV